MRFSTKRFGIGIAATLVGSVSAASAANLIQNSGFSTAASQSQVIEGAYAPVYGIWEPTTVYDWTAGGTYDLIVYPGQGDDPSVLINGFELAGPKSGYANGLTDTGPGGGNYIALDGSYAGEISQTLSGLVVGTTYDLSFYFAAAQEINAGGATTEEITATLGDQSFSTETLNNPSQGFTPWRLESFSFVYDGSGTVLSFLATGVGSPPYALINDPMLTGGAAGAPEISTWAMVVAGFAGVGVLARRRRKVSLATA